MDTRKLIPMIMSFSCIASSALAGEGVLEINATCAVQGGCFPGDSPGYPVTITPASGGSSFHLSSDLVVPNETTSGVSVGASDVSIDLGGFSIIRAACVGATASCVAPSGIGEGVGVTSPSTISGVSVKNGSVVGMGGSGIRLGGHGDVRDVRVRWNRSFGIDAEQGVIVSGSVVRGNGFGIRTDQGATISGSTVSGSGSTGISSQSRSNISGNSVFDNLGNGIFCAESCVISENAVAGNSGRGIAGSSGSRVAQNVVRSNLGWGISVGQSSVVEGNTVSANGGIGIATGYLAHVVDNGLDGNAGTAIDASDGSNISRNTIGPITASFSSFIGITCSAGCAVYDNLVRNTSQAMIMGSGSRYGRNVLTLTPNPAVLGSGVSAGDNLCDGVSC